MPASCFPCRSLQNRRRKYRTQCGEKSSRSATVTHLTPVAPSPTPSSSPPPHPCPGDGCGFAVEIRGASAGSSPWWEWLTGHCPIILLGHPRDLATVANRHDAVSGSPLLSRGRQQRHIRYDLNGQVEHRSESVRSSIRLRATISLNGFIKSAVPPRGRLCDPFTRYLSAWSVCGRARAACRHLQRYIRIGGKTSRILDGHRHVFWVAQPDHGRRGSLLLARACPESCRVCFNWLAWPAQSVRAQSLGQYTRWPPDLNGGFRAFMPPK